jgi:hypothetical protein
MVLGSHPEGLVSVAALFDEISTYADQASELGSVLAGTHPPIPNEFPRSKGERWRSLACLEGGEACHV